MVSTTTIDFVAPPLNEQFLDATNLPKAVRCTRKVRQTFSPLGRSTSMRLLGTPSLMPAGVSTLLRQWPLFLPTTCGRFCEGLDEDLVGAPPLVGRDL